ncbi:Origin recognition complex subunit 1 [Cryptosporidium felis]|nr:Origin recognition complex subunit 1 [Cryptosporidium felis]
MPVVNRNITSFELRQSTGSKLQSSKLVENTNIVGRSNKRNEKRYMLNTNYLNAELNENAMCSKNRISGGKKRKILNEENPGVKTRRQTRKTKYEQSYENHPFDAEFLQSPIVTPQGYHLYVHLVIENDGERDVFTVGDHVMVYLSGGGERPAQITAFLYDPEKNLQGVELRWFYSENDLLNLGKIIDKSKLPDELFLFEEEFLESDKCEVLEASVIKRMIRIWNIKRDYLKWTRDYLGLYSGPQSCGDPLGENSEEKPQKAIKFHDQRLSQYIQEFNQDLPSFSIEVSDNYLALFIVLTDTGTIVPISERRNTSYLLSRCSSYFGYYVNHFETKLSTSPTFSNPLGVDLPDLGLEKGSNDLHWSKRPKKILPCREKEHEEITQILKTSILSEGGGVLFIAGLPGTGKTATVLNTLEMLENEINLSQKNANKISVCYINALHLSSPDHFYRTFLQKLNGADTWAPSKEACYSSLDKYLKANGSPITILVVDEIDWLQKGGSSSSESNTSLLYALIDWPFQQNTKLIIIAIANTMDLPERLIPRCTSRCGYARVNFTPFSVDDMVKILNERVKHFKRDVEEQGGDVQKASLESSRRSSPRVKNRNKNLIPRDDSESLFCEKAVEFCARRVSQQSSDVRRALQVLHRAWEICRSEFEQSKKRNSRKLKVQIPHVQAACKEVMLNNISMNLIETLPLVYKVFLASLILELEQKHRQEEIYDAETSLLEMSSVNENFVSLLKIEKRMSTLLSLAGQFYSECMDTEITKKMTRVLISTRIIQTIKGPYLSSSYPKKNGGPKGEGRLEKELETYYETINLFGSDVWVSLLLDPVSLKSYLIRNLPFRIKGFE